MEAYEGDMIASALLSNGKKVFRLTKKEKNQEVYFVLSVDVQIV